MADVQPAAFVPAPIEDDSDELIISERLAEPFVAFES
jgi:hypothetical protein